MEDRPLDLDKQYSSSTTETHSSESLQMPTEGGKQPSSKDVEINKIELSKPVENIDVTSEQETSESGQVLQTSKDKSPESRDMTLGSRVEFKIKLNEGHVKDSGANRQAVLDLASDEKSTDNQRLPADPNYSERATVDCSSPNSPYKHDNGFYATQPYLSHLSPLLPVLLPYEENIIPDLAYARRHDISAEASACTGVSGNHGCESAQDYSTRTTVDYSSPNYPDKHYSRCHTTTLPSASLSTLIGMFPSAEIKDNPDCRMRTTVDYSSPRPPDKNTNRFYGTTLPSTSLSSSIGMFPDEKNINLDLECDNDFWRDYNSAETSTNAGVSGNRGCESAQNYSTTPNKASIYKCGKCTESFSDANDFYVHLKVHGKPYICKVCERKFVRRDSYIRHIDFH